MGWEYKILQRLELNAAESTLNELGKKGWDIFHVVNLVDSGIRVFLRRASLNTH